jgi:formate-dependent nitrite reductase membrane component NrfD
MLRVFNSKSPLSIGSWILAAGSVASGVAAAVPERKRIGRVVGNVAGLAAGTLGIPLAGYTGVLLSTTSVPVWQKSQRYLPALFVASAVASCASLFELLELSPRETAIAHRFGVAGKAAELVCMTAVEFDLSADSVAAEPLHSGISGALWTAAKVLTVASLAVSLMPGQSRKTRVAGVLGTMAGIGLRFAVFYAGFSSARDPRAASGRG